MKLLIKSFALFFLFMLGVVAFDAVTSHTAHAASSPHDVESSVRSGWNSLSGGKNFTMETGGQLVYDVYGSKYISGGYQVVNKAFSGHSSQPLFTFYGVVFLIKYYL